MKPIPFFRKATGLAGFAVPAALAFVVAACVFDDKQASSRGTVVDNELRVGTIYLADGSPAVGARVRVFPVGYVPDSSSQATGAIFSTRTDTNGRYTVDTLPKGEYNILGESDGEYSFKDSVYIAPNTDSISADTLDSPGSILGMVGLQPQHNPISVVVQVLGTNTYVNVGDDGIFRLTGMAQGKYSLRLLSSLKEYVSLSHPIRIRTGKSDTLKDTLRLPFTGIPVIQGLTAAYDTAKGVVVLKWKPVKYRDFSEYVVFRDVAPVLLPSVKALAIAQDTVFYDSLGKYPGDDFSWGNGRVSLEYRVKVKNQIDEIGPSYGKARVVVIDPDALGTQVRIDTAWSFRDPVRQKDSVIAIAVLTSTKVIADTLVWYAHDDTLRWAPPSRAVKLMSGVSPSDTLRDTLRIEITGNQNTMVMARVTDVNKRSRVDSALVFVNSPPQIVTWWPDTVIVNPESAFVFHLPIFDADGDSVFVSAEGLPAWLRLESNPWALVGTVGADTGDYPVILIKVEDARHSVTRTLRIRVAY